MPKVSVVIPNFNHEKYLSERIRSVLDQRYTDFDVLILDDRSTDDSRRVIASFQPDARIRILYNDTNSGSTFRQWAKGLAETRGDYVWIAESDDASDPGFLETLVPLLDAHPKVGMAVCASVAIDEAGVRDERHFDSWHAFGVPAESIEVMRTDLVMDGADYCRRHMVPWTTIPNASAVLFRREALAGHVGAGLEMKLGGDSMVYCSILRDHDIARSAAPLNFFRQHTQNVRSKTPPSLFVSEVLKIQAYIATHFGATTLPARTWEFFTQFLLGHERSTSANKVPLQRIPGVLATARALHPRLFLSTARVLATELLAEAVWRMRGRRSVVLASD